MASVDKPADPEYKSSSSTPAPAAVDYFNVDVLLRILLFAASLVVIVVIVTSDQTEPFPPGSFDQRELRFKHSAAFIYFLVAFCVSGLYSLLSALASFSVIQKPDLKLKFLLHFIFWDVLILGVIASATGTAGGVAYQDLKGNDHVDWQKVCKVYDKFCRHLAGSLAVALFGSIVVVLLIWLSVYSIHSRVPK
ncbi:hypothetical protein L6164_025496 [Bauhinia variegata]|uniref:Uncharacterized protein n=1 Tax=Bauhinia variegata TaxID=167791 RepID=A0ACB9M3F4_BAUVA|nr:hypothetical protein L6164_025496 [Bauhinia variegata]